MKKTDRDKDWPMVEAISWQMHDDWSALLHLRTPEKLTGTWQRCPDEIRAALIARRPLLATLDTREIGLAKALAIERLIWEHVNKLRYRRYQTEWKDFLRRWKSDPAHNWPVELPFTAQHEMLCDAVVSHQLPVSPLGDTVERQRLVERAYQSVLEVFDGQEAIVHQLTPPLGELLP